MLLNPINRGRRVMDDANCPNSSWIGQQQTRREGQWRILSATEPLSPPVDSLEHSPASKFSFRPCFELIPNLQWSHVFRVP